MTIQYTWKILELDCEVDVEHPCSVISKVHLKLTGIENGFEGFIYDIMYLNYNTTTGISFNNLTESDIINLIQEKLNQLSASESIPFYQPIEQQIKDKVFPVGNSVNTPLPWIIS